MGAETPSEFKVPVKGVGGEDKGTLELPAAKLDSRVRYALLKEAIVMYEANRRVGTHKTKTRGEIRGSNHKPWRQKGTGRARPGSKKSPLWRGGGTVFGPRPRDYSYSINRKQKRRAASSALFGRFRDGEVLVLDGLALDGPKTKTVAAALSAAGVAGSCLIGTAGLDRDLALSARNIPGVLVAPLSDFNARDVLRVSTVVLTREAFDAVADQGLAPAASSGAAAESGGGGES